MYGLPLTQKGIIMKKFEITPSVMVNVDILNDIQGLMNHGVLRELLTIDQDSSEWSRNKVTDYILESQNRVPGSEVPNVLKMLDAARFAKMRGANVKLSFFQLMNQDGSPSKLYYMMLATEGGETIDDIITGKHIAFGGAVMFTVE